MPPRSKVMALPDDVRSELDRRLIKSSFSGYEQLTDWLQEQGFEIAKASVHRYGSALEREVAESHRVVQDAKAVVTDFDQSDSDSVTEASLQLLQRKLLDTLLWAEQLEQADLARLTHTAAELDRTVIARQRWYEELDKIEEAEYAASSNEQRTELRQRYLRGAAGGNGGFADSDPASPAAQNRTGHTSDDQDGSEDGQEKG